MSDLFWHVLFALLTNDRVCCMPSSTTRSRIIGGSPCDSHKSAVMATLHRWHTGEHFCGGTLLNSQWILTAAHCCDPHYQPGYIIAYLGVMSQTNLDAGMKVPVTRNILHPLYNFKTYANDIGLMKLRSEVQESDQIRFVNIAMPNGSKWLEEICNEGIAMGWGSQTVVDFRTRRPGDPYNLPPNDPMLQCTNLQVPKYTYCVYHGSPTFAGRKFCAMMPDGSHDICIGDSGGPLMCGDVQYGIISAGRGCGIKDLPGTFTRVEFYDDFIKDTLERYPDKSSVDTYKLKVFHTVDVTICVLAFIYFIA